MIFFIRQAEIENMLAKTDRLWANHDQWNTLNNCVDIFFAEIQF